MDGQSEHTIKVLEDMLQACVMDFGGKWDQFFPLVEFAYNNSYYSSNHMAPFEALYGRHCHSPDRLRIAQSRDQSYTDHRRQSLRFVVGDIVFLYVSLIKRIMRFGRRFKLSLRYIGPFKILRTVGEVAYELALPPAFLAIYPIFHILMLRWYIIDESHVLQYDAIDLDDYLSYIEEPVAILARDVRQLHSRAIPIVKVHWRHRPMEESTWETKCEMRAWFSGLFEPSGLWESEKVVTIYLYASVPFGFMGAR
ncbi:uncharacterized protein LOC129883532 [Solanum dulcamara]|uniref:uncharacterized protein LOC129883532 n=1 Tax=Solanum dulcamara TaxID=45834 RepID=UPI002485CB3E|nr:uncharacterized protein LOC129883532 [Solanum dulcamara]